MSFFCTLGKFFCAFIQKNAGSLHRGLFFLRGRGSLLRSRRCVVAAFCVPEPDGRPPRHCHSSRGRCMPAQPAVVSLRLAPVTRSIAPLQSSRARRAAGRSSCARGLQRGDGACHRREPQRDDGGLGGHAPPSGTVAMSGRTPVRLGDAERGDHAAPRAEKRASPAKEEEAAVKRPSIFLDECAKEFS